MNAAGGQVPGYRLDGPLPPGRRGPVLAAVRHADGRSVVVHLLNVRLDGARRRRFRARTDELRALPPAAHVVPLLDAGILDVRPFLVTPRADRSLADLIKVQGALPVDLVIEAGRAAVRALAVFAAAGLRHGNVTPANLLMTGVGAVGLTGPAIDVLDELDGMRSGPHRPPEELRAAGGGAPPGAADIYALGSTLWALLTGLPPYGDGADIHRRRRAEPLPGLARGDVPAGLARLLRRALSADPGGRPDLGTFAEALDAVAAAAPSDGLPLGDRLVTVPPVDPGDPAPFEPPAGDHPLGPGVRVLGDYEVTRTRLGSGSAGTVYRGVDRTRRDPVAVKVLGPRWRAGPWEKRFRREATILAETVGHPNLVKIRALVEEGSSLAIVMELVDGQDLKLLLSRGRLPPARACAILRDIAAAMRYLHGNGVLHRDIKPANVLIERGEHGQAKITDFGMARYLEDPTITGAGEVVGTTAYMAPELCKAEPATPASDVYSFGVLAYELLAGHRPFRCVEPAALVYAHLETTPPRPAGVSDPAWRLLSRCLEKDPSRRPRADDALRMLRVLPEARGDDRGPAPVAAARNHAAGGAPEGTADEAAPGEPTGGSALGDAARDTDAAGHPGRRRLLLVAAVSAVASATLLITLDVLRLGWVGPTATPARVIQKIDLPISVSSPSAGEIKVDWSADPQAVDAFNVQLQVSQREIPVSSRPSSTTIPHLRPTDRYCVHVSVSRVEDGTPTPAPQRPVCLAADGRGVTLTSSQ
jgi:serine/threonine-protein kinase